MYENSAKLIDLVDNVLQWSNVQTDQINPSFSEHDLEKIINNVVEVYRFFAINTGVEIITEINNKEIVTDNKILTIIIQNLLNNSIKFSENDSQIFIKSRKENHNIIIEIIDNGIGIEKKYLDKIFSEKFDSTQIKNSKNKGSGLGLKICKEFTELLGGYINVQSEKGKGSKFTLVFPD